MSAADAVQSELAAAAAELKRRGNIEFKRGDFRHAVELFSRANQLEPANEVHLANRCLALLKLERNDEALQDATVVLDVRPDWAKAHYRHGTALQALSRHAEAVASFERAVELDPGNKQVLAGLDEGRKQVCLAAEAAAAAELAARRKEERRQLEAARRVAGGATAAELSQPLLAGLDALPYVGWPVGVNVTETRGRGVVAARTQPPPCRWVWLRARAAGN